MTRKGTYTDMAAEEMARLDSGANATRVEPEPDTPRRGKPYVWVTWIVGLLAGSSRCEWAPWFKAHHSYAKKEDPDFDLDAWTADHARRVTERANDLRARGYNVGVEDDNKFNLRGEVAVLGGKPDILAIKGIEVDVWDEKTGKERESDRWQVRVYLYALPRVVKNLPKKIVGILDYSGRLVQVDPPTRVEIARLGTIMQMVGGDLEPPRTPSPGECSRCDILRCPDRDSSGPKEGETRDF